jgi:hypothetical protein
MAGKFDNFSNAEKHLLFEALFHCIRTNSGIGFKAYHQGDIVYEQGAIDGTHDDADSPEANKFYQMYRELSLHMVDWPAISAFRPVCVSDWQQFCKLALHYYNRLNGRKLIEGAAEEMHSRARPRL